MSLNRKKELIEAAKVICRELRKNPTEAENIVWKAVRNRQLNGKKFNRQHPIFHDITGRETFFVADFCCYEKKLIVELDGIIHNFKLKKNEERTKILNNLGLKVIRFKNDEVFNSLYDVLERIKSFLR